MTRNNAENKVFRHEDRLISNGRIHRRRFTASSTAVRARIIYSLGDLVRDVDFGVPFARATIYDVAGNVTSAWNDSEDLARG